MAGNPWDAEHPVEAALARRLIGSARPELARHELELVGRGWDVDVWRAGDFAFRFPRRALGVECVENELRVVPAIAPLLPIRVPSPEIVGRPSAEFPYAWFGHRFIVGTTADRAQLSDERRTALAEPLARFLRALHDISVEDATPAGARPDAIRRDLELVRRRSLDRLTALDSTRVAPRMSLMRAALERLPAPQTEADAVIHGDLYARHLILDDDALAAVIDWGDVCLGDRAVDLDIVYSFLPPSARGAFFAVYGAVDDAMRERARFFALNRHAIALIAYALDVGDDPLAAEAERALDFVLG